jgi:hypothetical protein
MTNSGDAQAIVDKLSSRLRAEHLSAVPVERLIRDATSPV